MSNVYICSNGCVKRLLDTTKISNYFLKNGYKTVNNPKDADIIIFVTCAVFEEITESSIKQIKKLKKYDAELIIAGCLPEIEKEKLSQIFKGKTIITKEIDKIDYFFPNNKIKFVELDDANLPFGSEGIPFLEFSLRGTIFSKILMKIFKEIKFTKNIYIFIIKHIFKNILGKDSTGYKHLISTKKCFNIKILDGCLGDCSYCSIKKAVGILHSKPIDECIKEFKNGLKDGYKNFELDGDDVGAYGIDIKTSFPELLDKMTKIPGDYKISIKDFNSCWLAKYIDNLEEIIKRKKINYILVAFQSGSNRILNLMKRHSDIDKVKNSCKRLKKIYPDLEISSHAIVGFPTETIEDFKQTLSFIAESNIDGGTFFTFSPRPKTLAEKIEPKVSEKEKESRMKYAKKFLEKKGYNVFYPPGRSILIFGK